MPRVIVDGYNLIHQMPELARYLDSDLERARDMLVMRLADYKSIRNTDVTVVFDGQGSAIPGTRPPGGVEVVFARSPQTADQRIQAMLAHEKHPRSWTVVTSDRSIVIHARDYGAKTVSSSDFARLLSPGSPNRQSSIASRQSDKPEMKPGDVADWEAYFRSGRARGK